MCESPSIQIFVLARYPVVRAGFRAFLQASERMRLVGEAASIDETMVKLREIQADVIVIDPDTEDITMSAVDSVARACDSRILVFTASPDRCACVHAIELGASGIVSKRQPSELLLRAILKVHEGELWLDRAQTAAVLSHAIHRSRDPEQAKVESLTKREREIVARVGEGLKNSLIAERLFISEATVRNHLTSILAKLGLADRFELAVYAFRHGLVESGGSSADREHAALDRSAALGTHPVDTKGSGIVRWAPKTEA